MSRRRPRVAVLGGGMAGLAAAWRLSEPGWRDRFESITVHQRGWRLGGKGASSRGVHGRIEEHGLHLWLGFYDNAFRLVREVYDEVDRPVTDPGAPIRRWDEAFLPWGTIGLEDRHDGSWEHWLATFTGNVRAPGDPLDARRRPTVADYVQRALRMVLDFVEALPGADGAGGVVLTTSAVAPRSPVVATLARGARVLLPAVLLEAARLGGEAAGDGKGDGDGNGDGGADRAAVVAALAALQADLAAIVAGDAGLRRAWQHVSLSIALVRGLVADGVVADPRRLRALDDEDFLAWMRRHRADPAAVDGAFLRGMYDLVLAYEDGDPARPAFSAGTAVLVTLKMLLEHDGAVFWKMAAGMGDVVFAPLHQALVARGVRIEYFSRVDALHVDPAGRRVGAVTVGRQVPLRPGRDAYDPLIRVGGLPCYPAAPLVDQLDAPAAVAAEPLEAQWCTWPDAERRVLRDGADYDALVLAIPVGAAPTVCAELVADRPEWAEMVAGLTTVATQSAQLWLAEDERALGWSSPGAVVSGYTTPFDTWASMPHLPAVERWPAGDRPATVAYLCSVLEDAAAGACPPAEVDAAAAADARARVRSNVVRFLDRDVAHLLPGAHDAGRFRDDLLCGAHGLSGVEAVATQHVAANVDASDRYVQSRPGSGRVRLRPDESGYDNVVLAGDWTDSGLNAGCIEAATLSGLQAANALLGRARNHRVTAYDLA